MIRLIVWGGLITVGFFGSGAAQEDPQPLPPPPETEIYLADLSIEKDRVSVTNPRNVTNHAGYDNQPYFLPDGQAFFYVAQGANEKMDIWRYDLAFGTRTQMTDTPRESEYSPKLTPDGQGLSVIHEKEDRTGQQVWRYDLDDPKSGRALLELNPVGYYAWGQGGDYLAVFALGDPPTLRLADMKSGEIEIMYENIGRALYAAPDGAGYYFTSPLAEDRFQVLYLALEDKSIEDRFELPGANEHYALTALDEDVAFFSANGGKLYFRIGAADTGWQEIADLSGAGITNITRLAVSPDHRRIAFVVSE